MLSNSLILKRTEGGFYQKISNDAKKLDTNGKFRTFFEDLCKTGDFKQVLRKYNFGVNGIYNKNYINIYTPLCISLYVRYAKKAEMHVQLKKNMQKKTKMQKRAKKRPHYNVCTLEQGQSLNARDTRIAFYKDLMQWADYEESRVPFRYALFWHYYRSRIFRFDIKNMC